MFLGITSSRIWPSSCWRRQRLRRAMATARLASFWPMMKRSSSETISRGEKLLICDNSWHVRCRLGMRWKPAYKGGGNSRTARGSHAPLPGLHRFQRIDQHQHVEGEIVADKVAYDQLGGHSQRHGEPDGQASGEEEAQHHEQRVGDG